MRRSIARRGLPRAPRRGGEGARGALGRHAGANNPRLYGPAARVARARLAPGRDPTGPRIGRPTGPEEGVADRAGENAAAAYCPLTRRAVLLLALRAGAVGSAAPGDQ